MSEPEKAPELASTYLRLKELIHTLETEAESVRERLKEAIGFDSVTEAKAWEYPDDGVKVQWVKGRTTERLDRSKLVQAGVTKEQIEKGTVRQQFPPSMRVVGLGSPVSSED